MSISYVEYDKPESRRKNYLSKQTTNYPWDGEVQVEVAKTSGKPFNIMIRIPGWAKNEVLPMTYTPMQIINSKSIA